MGAAAISTNAGTTLFAANSATGLLVLARPALEIASFVLWVWGTWWIPLLFLLGAWKYLVHRMPLAYSPGLWAFVFPLGMYAVATHHLSATAELPGWEFVSSAFAWIAIAAWVATAAGLVLANARSFREFRAELGGGTKAA